MAWANQGDTFNSHDMDSSNGTAAQKLRVRNATTPPAAQTYRAEIAERVTGVEPQALKVVGNVELAEYRDSADRVAGSLIVESAGLVINGRTDQELPSDGDPDLFLGWNRGSLGNQVFIGARETAIGPGQSPETGYPVTLQAPVKIPGSAAGGSGELVMEGRIVTRYVDGRALGTDHVLSLGDTNASRVDVGQTGINTQVQGSLRVNQATDLYGAVQTHGQSINTQGGSITMQGGSLNTGGGSVTAEGLTAVGAVTAASLDVNGSGDVAGDLAVHGSLNSDASIHAFNTISASILEGNSLTVGAGASVTLDLAVGGELEVQHDTTVHGTLDAQGKILCGDTVNLKGQDLLMGSSTTTDVRLRFANNRLEILVGGVLRFYVDNTGGHNA